MENDHLDPQFRMPDGISCVGLILLAIIVLSTLGVGLGTAAAGRRIDYAEVAAVQSPTIEPTATENSPVGLEQIRPAATGTPSFTPEPSETSTPVPSSTATSTASPTHTPTIVPSLTPSLTPSSTPTDAPTMTNTPLPTSTATPTPLPTPSGSVSNTLRVPILMYHYISIPPEDADQYRLDLSVSPELFRQHMTYLHDAGYNTIDLYQLSRAITNKESLPPNPIVITLDDGYRDNYENAFPVLDEFGMTATFFLVTDPIDQGHPQYMSWAMIEEMTQKGMRFEPHSKTHPDLSVQDRETIIYQVLGSRETIEAHIGYKPRYFAYPSGRYDDSVLEIVEELDYWGAVTTNGGYWHGYNDRYEWSRVRIRNVTNLAEFIDLVE